MRVKIKWNKQVFDDVEVDPSLGVEVFKSQIFSLTGVPIERQKLMAKGAWPGVLKDDADMTSMKITDGLQIMLMGTADVVVQAPAEKPVFVEDMTEKEKAIKGATEPAGLINLGNTCYLNSTVQCFRHMPELRQALSTVRSGGVDSSVVSAFRDTLIQLDHSVESIPPAQFVSVLRSQFPQFAQRTSHGGFMQQDAEEFYNTIMHSMSTALAATNQSLDKYLGFEVEETLRCLECPEEPPVVRTERLTKLVCNIQGGAGSTIQINHIHEGLKIGFEGTVEKYSEILGRNALWSKTQKMKTLPIYACVQFMRFFWKATPESMDHAGVKCKIMRKVNYGEVLDVFELCDERLQSGLKHNRLIADKKLEEQYANESRKRALEETPAQSSDAMEVTDPAPVSEEVQPSPMQGKFGDGIPDDFGGLYELMGVVTHKGRSADSGHYIGWVRESPGSNTWWKYDDNVVTAVTTEEILALNGGGDWHTAYLNFYRYKGH